MLNICDNYAKDYNVVFIANKSKLIFVTTGRFKQLNVGPIPVFKINGQTIDYVDQWPRIGHIISNNLHYKADFMQRRNSMVGQINNVLCYFGKLNNFLKPRLFNSYCASLYGSILWDLSNPCIESVYI